MMESEENEQIVSRISKKTRALLEKQGVKVVYVDSKKPITRKNILQITSNFDLLQYYGTVRSYLCAKYGINRDEIEVLFSLHPKGLFTVTDFHAVPKASKVTFKILLEKKLVDFFLNNETKHSATYRLSKVAKLIVKEFHTYLLDPSKMPAIKKVAAPSKEKKKFKKMDQLILKLKISK